MTTFDLIEILSQLPPDMLVAFPLDEEIISPCVVNSDIATVDDSKGDLVEVFLLLPCTCHLHDLDAGANDSFGPNIGDNDWDDNLDEEFVEDVKVEKINLN